MTTLRCVMGVCADGGQLEVQSYHASWGSWQRCLIVLQQENGCV